MQGIFLKNSHSCFLVPGTFWRAGEFWGVGKDLKDEKDLKDGRVARGTLLTPGTGISLHWGEAGWGFPLARRQLWRKGLPFPAPSAFIPSVSHPMNKRALSERDICT